MFVLNKYSHNMQNQTVFSAQKRFFSAERKIVWLKAKKSSPHDFWKLCGERFIMAVPEGLFCFVTALFFSISRGFPFLFQLSFIRLLAHSGRRLCDFVRRVDRGLCPHASERR